MIYKVCGMRDPANIRAVEEVPVDWMGFIFWPGSKRYVNHLPAYMPRPGVQRVGVFVDSSIDDIVEHVRIFGLHLVQLHGHETADFCLQVKAATGLQIIKAFCIATLEDLRQTGAYAEVADYFLFDTKAPLPGGSGRQFDWHILDAYDGNVPFLLSGGIGPSDLPRLATFSHPRWAGIDLNSCFETHPGIKDADLLHAFINRKEQSSLTHLQKTLI